MHRNGHFVYFDTKLTEVYLRLPMADEPAKAKTWWHVDRSQHHGGDIPTDTLTRNGWMGENVGDHLGSKEGREK